MAMPVELDQLFPVALHDTVAAGADTDERAKVIGGHAPYAGAAATLPTFTGDHDIGRCAYLVRKPLPGMGDAEVPARVAPATALLLAFRGGPFIDFADQQG